MRLLVTFIFLFIDLFFNLAFAQSANNDPLFSFAPPASDASLVYLADLFGVVDGVLAGTGSQLFGHMMGVFNTAVLAFSSVITTYVLILGTVNTAHEGEFLGKQWSSIMLPLRILMGMALLVPKLSGYCLAQIMFMWVVVQGVGAADKIWNAALSYLNQGGQLVSEQLSTKKIAQDNDKSPQMDNVYVGAGKMLAGIVCMYGLQQWIMNLHTNYCQNNTSDFCKTDPPNFLSSIDAVGYAGTKTETQYLPMPNLTDGSIWANLNGKCGSISWVPINTDFSGIVGGNNSGAKTENNTIAKATRNIAVQTMYTFLTNVGMAIINNDPVFNTNVQYSSSDTRSKAASYAKLEFGVVLDDQRQICTKQDDKCNTWGGVSSASTVLFTGNEFLNAILAYYGVMQPYFSLVQQQNDAKRQAAAQESRKFIAEAQNVGWMYAGAYFFKLINLSNSNVLSLPEGAGMIHDIDAHLDKSTDLSVDLSK